MQSVTVEQPAPCPSDGRGTTVRFLENDRELSGLIITVPGALTHLPRLCLALRGLCIQVTRVELASTPDDTTCQLDLAELDGSAVSRERWGALQGVVLTCILENSNAVLPLASTRLARPGRSQRRWAAFRNLLQNAPRPNRAFARRRA